MIDTNGDASPDSIYDLPPLETGGIEARQGFRFQDHVAAGFCLDMLLNDELREVWCETQDDVTLIWTNGNGIRVEFVQAKSNKLNQLWSVAKLCERKKKKNGTSIIEKSLAYDRCSEPTSFRIVTSRDVQGDLSPLCLPLGDPDRLPKAAELASVLDEKVGTFTSPNGNSCEFWVENSTWSVPGKEEALKNTNLLKLQNIMEAKTIFLARDQQEELYAKLLAKVKNAGDASEREGREQKQIRRDPLNEWFHETTEKLLHPASAGGGAALRQKMLLADIPDDTILSALEARRSYVGEVMQHRYMDIDHRTEVEGEILAELQELKSNLDCGKWPDSGIDFHARCLERLRKLRDSWTRPTKPPLNIMHGCMYSVTDRCLHRFRRAQE